MTRVVSLPKWLLQEAFDLHYQPQEIACAQWRVVLTDRAGRAHEGAGGTITEAAKAALAKRDENKKLVSMRGA